VPSWCRYQLESYNESVLFGFSDRPLQRYLGVLREERG
jgi:gentisate 1,2-dioxygenase